MKIKICIILLSITTLIQCDIRSLIDKYLSLLTNKNQFSGSVLIAQNDQILLSKGYGFADQTNMNTPQTQFQIGSITKQFIAAYILLLQERNLLKVGDTINKFISDFPHGDKITIHHLLTHSSGIYRLFSKEEIAKIFCDYKTNKTIVNFIKKQVPSFLPGEHVEYNSTGYILLEYIIEKITHKPLSDALNQIFKKIKMYNTGVKTNKNCATGYKYQGGKLVPSDTTNLGTQSLYSTVEDLYLWYRALKNQNKPLTKNIIKLMLTPYIFMKGRVWQAHYGYGLYFDEMCNHKRTFHHGGTIGFLGSISMFFEENICIIMLGNIENFKHYQITQNIAKILFSNSAKFNKWQSKL